MSGFETRFAANEDADRIRRLFYGFLERHGRDIEGPAHIRTEFDGQGCQLLVRLWSAEAMRAFLKDVRTPAGR
jgi:hypothetical protein